MWQFFQERGGCVGSKAWLGRREIDSVESGSISTACGIGYGNNPESIGRGGYEAVNLLVNLER
jgi:hypothetical protein